MIEKDDWRLTGHEDYLKNLKLIKIKFPDFWQKAYKEKNFFYQKIVDEAEKFVREFHRGEEYLEGEKIQALWHEHCDFCWKKFMTDIDIEGYCTPEYNLWICKDCFEDFKEMFNFSVIENQ